MTKNVCQSLHVGADLHLPSGMAMAETMGPAVFLEAGSTGENVYPVSQRTGTGESPEGHLLTQKDLARGRRSWTRVADIVCQRTGNLGQQWQPQGRSGFAPDNMQPAGLSIDVG